MLLPNNGSTFTGRGRRPAFESEGPSWPRSSAVFGYAAPPRPPDAFMIRPTAPSTNPSAGTAMRNACCCWLAAGPLRNSKYAPKNRRKAPPAISLSAQDFPIAAPFSHVSSCCITDQHSLAGADDQRGNYKDRCGPGPVQCLVSGHGRTAGVWREPSAPPGLCSPSHGTAQRPSL
jgi:hypothetical protein